MTSIIFTKYPSLTNHYQTKFIDLIQSHGLDGGLWFVQEKIHGANFCIVSDGESVRAAKRSGLIDDSENFYGSEAVLNKYRQKALDIAYGYEDTVMIYGEIFGGYYNSTQEVGAKRVQRGIDYCPWNDFMVFDIRIGGKFIDYLEMTSICAHLGFKAAPTLFSGTFEECLKYPNEFPTVVPRALGLTTEVPDNICEGIVIRPNVTKFFPNSDRVIIKSKNSRFSEVVSKTPKPRIREKGTEELSPEVEKAIDELLPYVTENRINNLRSKLSPEEFVIVNFNRILGLFIKDILDEYEGDVLESLSTEQDKYVKKILSKESSGIIRCSLLQQ